MDEARKAAMAELARRELAKRQAQQPRGLGQRLYDNLIGDPNDGVTSTGEALGTWLNRAGESATLGVVGDEASAAATGMLPGRSYESELERYRSNEDNMSTMGRLSADVAGAVAPGLAGLGIVAGGVTRGAQAARAAGLGAGAGGLFGVMEGEGASDRLMGGATGAAFGGAIGAATPALAGLAKNAWRNVAESRAGKRIVKDVAGQFGISRKAGGLLDDVVGMDDAARMRQALSSPDAMLADAGPSTQGALDAVIQSPGEGARTAMRRIDDRAATAGRDTDGILNKVLGIPEGVETTKSGIRSSTAAGRKTAYDAAYSREIDWRSPAGEELRELIASTPEEVLQSAARTRSMGVPAPDRLARYADDFADTVTTGTGPMSRATQEADDIGQFFARYDELSGQSMAKRPVSRVIQGLGGVDPDSPAGRELKGMGITSKNSPALFRKGGLRDLDNLSPDLFPDTIRARGDGTGNYLDRQALLDSVVSEQGGRAVRNASDEMSVRELEELERLLPDYTARREALASRQAAIPQDPGIVGDIVPTRTVQDIDLIKRELDRIANSNDGMGLFGGQTPVGTAAKARARAIRDKLAEAVPEYRNALDTAADPIRRVQAVDAGRDLLKPGTSREKAREMIADMTAGERSAVKQGLRSQIDDALARVQAVASDPNVDAREASRMLSMLSSRDARDKMKILLTDNEFTALSRQLDVASRALGLRARVATNSRTFQRQQFGQMMDDSLAPGPLASGEWIDGMATMTNPVKGALRAVTGASQKSINKAGAKARNELADVLTRPGAQQALDAIAQIRNNNAIPKNAGNALQQLLMLNLIGNSGRLGDATGSLMRRLPGS